MSDSHPWIGGSAASDRDVVKKAPARSISSVFGRFISEPNWRRQKVKRLGGYGDCTLEGKTGRCVLVYPQEECAAVCVRLFSSRRAAVAVRERE